MSDLGIPELTGYPEPLTSWDPYPLLRPLRKVWGRYMAVLTAQFRPLTF